ncbi:MAG: hypothetical protein P4L57_02640, partial [Rhizomicrobium sp.]|nr:hypothetical protein [Rhizomicrobium sp.]
NRNAKGERSLRLHTHLKKQLLAQHLQLLVLAAAVSHLERRVAPQSPARALQHKGKFSQNNYLAEAAAMQQSQQRDDTSTPLLEIAPRDLQFPIAL